MDLESIRRDYVQGGLRRADLAADPLDQFERWLAQAINAKIPDPTAMTLATVNGQGEPSQRIVLLKHTDAQGLVFFTNYGSRKAADLAVNDRVSVHFPWHFMERQVKINGLAAKISVVETARYFLSRPRESQLAAWASAQSHPISSRQLLEMQYAQMKAKFAAGQIPTPDFWGGYRITPYRYEFWQGGSHRLHDRFVYEREADGWCIQRLAP
jgi:pyridoxamine 5'-phosphate oxidase